MATGAVDRNRLAGSTSPYLQAHADNPVHWQPWDDAALGAAESRDVPIFLSIGYAACHWCHVMAEESFEDETVAAVLNDRYVPVKVDREERPDLDRYYQTAAQLTTGRGGWPLSAWVTPDGRPFQLATYLPREPRREQPGFVDVLERIAERWRTDRAAIESHADDLVEAIRESRDDAGAPSSADRPVESNVETAAQAALRAFDPEHGGFGRSGPKFPQVSRLTLLIVAWQRTGRDRYREAVQTTLRSMASGGIHDHVEGGFHRYATDREWHVPHFEKMAYDNAGLLALYARAGDALDDADHRRTAAGIASFLRRRLRHPEGGFYCSLDADTAGGEGTTYTWTPAQVEAAVDDPFRRELLPRRFDVGDRRDVESGCVLRVRRSIESLSEEFDRSTGTIRDELDAGVEALRRAREERDQPERDEKVLAAWTGLAIGGFAQAGAHLEDRDLLEVAASARRFVERALWDADEGRLTRTFRDGRTAGIGFLEDYAAVATGSFDLYWADDDADALRFGLEVVDGMLDACWDDEEARLRFVPPSRAELPDDPLDPHDRSVPSALGLAVDAMATASGFRDDRTTERTIDATLDRYGPAVAANPLDNATLALAFDRWLEGPPSITVVGESIPPGWRRAIRRRGRDLLLTRRPPGELAGEVADDLGLAAVPPLWRSRERSNGETTAYPCRGRTCGRPVTSIDDALAWFDGD